VSKPGHRDPTIVNGHVLQGKKCIVSAAFRKTWASKPNYWVEIYHRPKPLLGLHCLFYVHRQWSWYSKQEDMLVENGQTSQGEPSLFEIDRIFKAYIKRLVTQQDYVLVNAKFDTYDDPDLENVTKRIQSTIEEIVDRDGVQIMTPTLPQTKQQSESLAMRFKRAQVERQKKTKW
jgi:hypothetical protein